MASTLRTDRLDEVVTQVEDLLMDDRADNFTLLTEGERDRVRAFEAVATTALEEGTPVIVNWLMADTLYEHSVVDASDFVGGKWPLGPKGERLHEDFDPADH